jgi:hypothetical protein
MQEKNSSHSHYLLFESNEMHGFQPLYETCEKESRGHEHVYSTWHAQLLVVYYHAKSGLEPPLGIEVVET